MVDINGQFRYITIPAQSLNEEVFINGIGFEASNYGYAVVEKSDMVFIPDPDTAMIDPFCESPTLTMNGNAMIINSPKQGKSLVFVYPKAYKGMSSGEICS